MLAPAPVARDARPGDDDVLASFAGVLAALNQASAPALVAPKKPEGISELEELPQVEACGDPEQPAADKNSKNANDLATPDSSPALPGLMPRAIAPLDSSSGDSTGGVATVARAPTVRRRSDALPLRIETAPPRLDPIAWRSETVSPHLEKVETAPPPLDTVLPPSGAAPRQLDTVPWHFDAVPLQLDAVPVRSDRIPLSATLPVRPDTTTPRPEATQLEPPLSRRLDAKPLRLDAVSVPSHAAAPQPTEPHTIAVSAPTPKRILNEQEPRLLVAPEPEQFDPPSLVSSHKAAVTEQDVVSTTPRQDVSDALDADRFIHASVLFEKSESPSTTVTKPPSTAAPQPQGTPVAAKSSTGSQRFGDRGREHSEQSGKGYNPSFVAQAHTINRSTTDAPAEVTSTAPQRAERIMAAVDQPAKPLSQIVLSVDAGNGATDRIQVALRGSTLSATIDAADFHVAHALRTHSDELVHALTRDGLDVDSVRVRTVASAAPPVAVDPSPRSSDSSANSGAEHRSQWEQQRKQPRSDDERRQQQRDERQGEDS